MRKHGFKFASCLALLASMVLGGCASQSETLRLKQEVEDLSRQLEYEKHRRDAILQRLKPAEAGRQE
jgi:outer membrane murein-binding lipoprotein Lpp